MKRQIIFVAGTSYSGSTLLDMILANDKRGYSLGEIAALFRPFRKHHLELKRQLSENKGWAQVFEDGEKHLYKSLFRLFPEVDFFVDSSKDVFWIRDQIKFNTRRNVQTKVVLVYKSTFELAASFAKRGLVEDWATAYINYYRRFFTLVEEFHTISYKGLLDPDSDAVKNLCTCLEIPFYPDKVHFWDKEHHTFFGNNRTRFHTQNLDTYGRSKTSMYKDDEKAKLIYQASISEGVSLRVREDISKHPEILTIDGILRNEFALANHTKLLRWLPMLVIRQNIKSLLKFIRLKLLLPK